MECENCDQRNADCEDQASAPSRLATYLSKPNRNPRHEGVPGQQKKLPIVEPAKDKRVKEIDTGASRSRSERASWNCPKGQKCRCEQNGEDQELSRQLRRE